MSVNKCIFIGNLGKDPETRYTADGGAVSNVSIAVTEKYKDQEKTEWIPVVFFGKLAEVVDKYLKKGAKVYIEGKYSTNKWQDKDGNNRYTTQIVGKVLEMLGGNSNSGQQQTTEYVDDDMSDPIPF